MKTFFKAIFIWICVFYALGCADNSRIAGNYHYSDLGTADSMIVKRNVNSLDEIVVDSRVDGVFVANDNIYIARRPTTYFKEGETMGVKLTNDCEFYIINVQDRSVTQVDKIPKEGGELTCLP